MIKNLSKIWSTYFNNFQWINKLNWKTLLNNFIKINYKKKNKSIKKNAKDQWNLSLKKISIKFNKNLQFLNNFKSISIHFIKYNVFSSRIRRLWKTMSSSKRLNPKVFLIKLKRNDNNLVKIGFTLMRCHMLLIMSVVNNLLISSLKTMAKLLNTTFSHIKICFKKEKILWFMLKTKRKSKQKKNKKFMEFQKKNQE